MQSVYGLLLCNVFTDFLYVMYLQYLKKENLSYPADISGNPWIQFCRASFSLKGKAKVVCFGYKYRSNYLMFHDELYFLYFDCHFGYTCKRLEC